MQETNNEDILAACRACLADPEMDSVLVIHESAVTTASCKPRNVSALREYLKAAAAASSNSSSNSMTTYACPPAIVLGYYVPIRRVLKYLRSSVSLSVADDTFHLLNMNPIDTVQSISALLCHRKTLEKMLSKVHAVDGMTGDDMGGLYVRLAKERTALVAAPVLFQASPMTVLSTYIDSFDMSDSTFKSVSDMVQWSQDSLMFTNHLLSLVKRHMRYILIRLALLLIVGLILVACLIMTLLPLAIENGRHLVQTICKSDILNKKPAWLPPFVLNFLKSLCEASI
jgi:hypothetical protein